MRKLITAATVLTLLGEPAAQEPVRNRILTDTDGRAIVWATDMPLHALVLKLARSARVPLVFEGEADADGSTSPDHAVPLDGRPLGEALDAIVRIDARYRWREQDGVVILRPVRQWGDSENPLNQVVGPVAWVGITRPRHSIACDS